MGAEQEQDVIIIGGGPAGSSLAINLLKNNRRVSIIEKSDFPRHHIGESLSGESALLLREMGLGDYMDSANFPVKKGVWVQGQNENAKFWVPVQNIEEDGSVTPATSYQVRRAEFDKKLLDTAIERGATLIKGRALEVTRDDDRVNGVKIMLESGEQKDFKAKIVADAAGQSCFFGRQDMLGEKSYNGYDKQVALYAYAKGVKRDPVPDDGNTHIFYGGTDHWTWLIPVDDEVTSLGVVVPHSKLKESNLDKTKFFLSSVDEINPHYGARMKNIEIVSEVRFISNYSYRYEKAAGPGYVSVGDSHGFVDPIFSFGVHFAIKEGVLAADAIEASLTEMSDDPLLAFEDNANDAHDVVRMIIDTFWQYPLAFLRLAHFSHVNDIATLFSGRLFGPQVHELEAVKLMKDLFAKAKSA